MKFTFRLILGLIACSLTACQGSNLGNSLEGAIAPAIPTSDSSPEPIAEQNKPAPSATPTVTPSKTSAEPVTTSSPSPTSSPSLTPKFSDRLNIPNFKSESLSNQMIEIALQALPNPSSAKIPNSLKTLFYINFATAQPQAGEFSDIEQAPVALRPWLKDLNKLGTITAKTGLQFQPNNLVARREYARWLLQTNNRLYKNQPSRQIRLAQPNDTPSFTDIPNNHPDFAIIQGLANAGLIGTGDRFRPNDPLLREELVQWKIPLDLRQPLPSATWDSISQTWGFKDSDRISENALGAIFADAQLRDISNIRRSFGFTTLLQPQKPVTRAEAAASLWYFGTATDGISANKVVELDR
jgi:hypothetical protein